MAGRHNKPLLSESINIKIDEIEKRIAFGDKTKVSRRLNIRPSCLDKFFTAPNSLSLIRIHEIIETFERYFKEVGR